MWERFKCFNVNFRLLSTICDSMACLLFNIALQKVVRNAGIQTSGTIFYKSVHLLTYADDIDTDIIARSIAALKGAFLSLERAAGEMG